MHLVFRIEQCSIRAKISLHEPWSLQNLFVVTREIDNMGDVGSEVRSHFYKGMVHWNAGRRGTVWYSKAPAVSGAIPMTHITQYFHEHSGQLDKYGDDWEESFRSRTEEADDITATDMMQHKDDELEGFVDYDIRDMGKGLLKHPKEKPLPGSGQLLVLLLGNMASGFPNLMTPTSGQLTGTMGSIYSWSHRSPKHPETRRDVRYRDATTSRLSTLITPTKERYEPFQTFQLSSPVPQDEESFSSKLTPSKKSKKGEKTRARKALKVKIPDGKKNAVPSSML
ncbi:unnamed protein product [Alternaria alternata]